MSFLQKINGYLTQDFYNKIIRAPISFYARLLRRIKLIKSFIILKNTFLNIKKEPSFLEKRLLFAILV
jgi:hypothetical protein